MTWLTNTKGCVGYAVKSHPTTTRALRYCGNIVMRFDAEWVTLRCPSKMLRVPRPMLDIDNSAISILDGLGRSWQQYAARRVGGWNITKRRHK